MGARPQDRNRRSTTSSGGQKRLLIYQHAQAGQACHSNLTARRKDDHHRLHRAHAFRGPAYQAPPPRPVGDIFQRLVRSLARRQPARNPPVGGCGTRSRMPTWATIKGHRRNPFVGGTYAALSTGRQWTAPPTPPIPIAHQRKPTPVRLHNGFHGHRRWHQWRPTNLQPVRGETLTTSFEAAGSIVRTKRIRRTDVELDITLEQGRIEDILKLGRAPVPPNA